MTQIRSAVNEGIQEKMIELLKQQNVHAMVLMGFAKKDGVEPLIVVAHDMPNQREFIEEFYALCDKYLDFHEVQRLSLLEEEKDGVS